MFLYCKSWDLEVNPTKTKVTIFTNKKLQNSPVFIYIGQELEIDDNFVYLGAMFSYNGRFQRHNQRLVDRGVTIHLPHDTIRIVILTSLYDTYRDTFNQTDRLTHTQPGHAISLLSC